MTTCAVVTAFGLFCLGFTALLAIGSLMGMFMKSRFEAVERARARRQDLAE